MVAAAQQIPLNFLENILGELRHAGIVRSQRGADGPRVWIAVRTNLRKVVEHVTLADVASGRLPSSINKLAEDPESWVTR